MMLLVLAGVMFYSFSSGPTSFIVDAQGESNNINNKAISAVPFLSRISDGVQTVEPNITPQCGLVPERDLDRPNLGKASCEIERKYQILGGASGFLGAPTDQVNIAPDRIGYFRHYVGGNIYWHPTLGTFEVHGPIFEKWGRYSWEVGLGYPIEDAQRTPTKPGLVQNFERAAIYLKEGNPEAFVIKRGPLLDKYAEHNWEQGHLGFPISDESNSEGGFRFNHFEGGTISWSPKTGAFERHMHDSNEARFHVRMPDGTLGENCQIAIDIFGPFYEKNDNVGGTFPAWVDMDGQKPVILEGEVVPGTSWDNWPHVSWQDTPYGHYSHDMTFRVKPDETADNQFTNLLPMRHHPEGPQRQESIEVEWESGLAASNSLNNPLAEANHRGTSGGFFSAGHRLGDVLWNWPTLGDHVHVVGKWVWDRGHPPAAAEIHPPRLVAVTRDLPAIVADGTVFGNADIFNPNVLPIPISDSEYVLDPVSTYKLSTRADIFASGDGGALWNNRNYPQYASFVEKIPMSEMDYTFDINHELPRPSDNARLVYKIFERDGHTFPIDPIITVHPDGTELNKTPHITVTIPWSSGRVDDTRVFARSIYLYWDEGSGVPDNYEFNTYVFRLNTINIKDNSDIGNDGEFRLFSEIGGRWTFLNEFAISQDQVNDDGILGDGLGDVGEGSAPGEPYPGPSTSPNGNIQRVFIAVVPEDKTLRIHAGGWDADATEPIMGRIFDPRHLCDSNLESDLNERVFGGNLIGVMSNFFGGCLDDPIGEINEVFRAEVINGRIGSGWTLDSFHPEVGEPACGDSPAGSNYSLSLRVYRLNTPL